MANSYVSTLPIDEQRRHHEVMAEYFALQPAIFPPNFAEHHRQRLAELGEKEADHASE
ncbi:hypothetical protein [Salibacterium salarium]|uniref:hypothetical protein n=1 Tax=Salibacterium salarium TaxID=284579 RepID=UPI001639FFAD|nr:hypothetical protein [Salibacterium salarium]